MNGLQVVLSSLCEGAYAIAVEVLASLDLAPTDAERSGTGNAPHATELAAVLPFDLATYRQSRWQDYRRDFDRLAEQADLEQYHGRAIATSYIQNVAEWVGTIYLAAAPEYGKQAFLQRLERELLRAKQHFPAARYLGIADGAASNWRFLEQHTDRQLIDFFQATEYVGKIAQATDPQRQAASKRAQWQHEHCAKLKHDPAALDRLIGDAARGANTLAGLEGLSSALIEGQRPDIARAVHHAHDDDFIVGEAVIQHVVAVEMRPQPRSQTLAARADFRMRLDRREPRLDLTDQL